jgi:hypothetical protein
LRGVPWPRRQTMPGLSALAAANPWARDPGQLLRGLGHVPEVCRAAGRGGRDKARALPVLPLWVREATRWAGSVPPDLQRSFAGTQAHRFPFRWGKAGASMPVPLLVLVHARTRQAPRDTVRALNTGRGRRSSLRGLGLKQSTATLSRIPSLTLYTRSRTGVPHIQAIVEPS